MFKKEKIFITNTININIRKTLIKTIVWIVVLYGTESWAKLKANRRKVEVFEIWCWRKVLNNSWTEQVLNEETYHRTNEKKSVLITIEVKRKQ